MKNINMREMQKYYDDGFSYAAIGRYYGISRQAVLKRLKKYDAKNGKRREIVIVEGLPDSENWVRKQYLRCLHETKEGKGSFSNEYPSICCKCGKTF